MSQPTGARPGFLVPVDRLQPSQLYISSVKLRCVRKQLDDCGPAVLGSLPVVHLGEDLILTDGHTRALAAWMSGMHRLYVAWDTDELDMQAYEICVQWCVQEGIRCIGDLRGRVVDPDAYQSLWLDRCAEMHRVLAARRSGE